MAAANVVGSPSVVRRHSVKFLLPQSLRCEYGSLWTQTNWPTAGGSSPPQESSSDADPDDYHYALGEESETSSDANVLGCRPFCGDVCTRADSALVDINPRFNPVPAPTLFQTSS